jgi:hypothetical protein
MDSASQKIGVKLDGRALPTEEPRNTWAGYGSRQPCAGCDCPIFATELEHEMAFAGGLRLHFHVACAHVWRVLKELVPEPRSA